MYIAKQNARLKLKLDWIVSKPTKKAQMKHGAVQIEVLKQKANRKCDEFVYNTFFYEPCTVG